jgi:hypothetical protein
MWRLMALPILLIVVVLAGDRALERKAWAAEAIELSQDDRAAIEKFLGKGVVGKAVPGNPIADATKFFTFEDGAWNFRFTNGDKKGKTQEQSFKKLKRDDTGTKGRYQNGPDIVNFLHRAKDGSITVSSEQDKDQGVISRFSPPEPIYVSGMNPGDSKQIKIDVKVYDLSDLKDVSHSGSLDLTYSYLGAYEVTVPAGTFQAALIKWDYKGKVGPASIEDTQYRFLAEGVGVVAMVEKKNISAMLVYHDHSKYGKVLVGKK